ncbi:MAG: BspA family leucine-rich repeat surface protein [Muribaculaceae bacterium]|nr:BspA family leucine-rich repeat surface protein [Muribaculaceae bacterium]
MNKTRFKSNRYVAIVALLIAMFALSPLAMAQEPQGYAEVIDGVLTFYWDADRDSRTGKTYSIPGPNQRPAWSGTDTAPNESTTKVVFDPSFINCEIQGCYDWFRQCTKLTTIEGLEYLNTSKAWTMESMFSCCTSLKSIDLSHFDMSSVENTNYMFYNCTSLESVDLSGTNMVKATTMEGMFKNCTSLKSVNFANCNTSNVTRMDGTFYGCSALTTLDLSQLDTSNLEWINDMFYGCSSLTELDMSTFDISKVTTMENTFRDCTSLVSLNTKSLYANNLQNLNNTFYNCKSLKSLDLRNFNKAPASMQATFYGCESLEDINLNTVGLWYANYLNDLFNGCKSLKELDLPDGPYNAKDVSNMFRDCTSLTTIYISNNGWNFRGTPTSDNMFLNCTSLKGAVAYNASKTDLRMANFTTGYLTSLAEKQIYGVESNGVLTLYYDRESGNRTGTVNIDPTDNSVPGWAGTEDNPNTTVTKVVFDKSFSKCQPTKTCYWFCYLTKLTTFEGLENLNTKKIKEMSKMYAGCSSLTSLDLSPFVTWALKSMYFMFADCSSLTSLEFPNFTTGSVTNMEGLFKGCSSLKSVDISNLDFAKASSINSMFEGCSSLTTLDLSEFDFSEARYANNLFKDCSSLTTLKLPNMKTKEMSNMFAGCSCLKSLDVSNLKTSIVSNMSNVFKGCTKLESIYCDNTWSCDNSTDMFAGCTALKGAVAFDASKTDASMANPNTGYFCGKTYVVIDKGTLSFYQDYQLKSRTGTSYLITERNAEDDSFPIWANNTTIKKVVIDDSFIAYAPSSTSKWFANCTALETVEGLENINGTSLISSSFMFYDCSSLTSISGFNFSKLYNTSYMFAGCSKLASLDVSGIRAILVTDMSNMFAGCSNLTSLDLSKSYVQSVTNMSRMFAGCSNIKTIVIKDSSAKIFSADKVTDMSEMFKGCAKLETIHCVDTWTCDNSTDMFAGCTSLKGAVAYDPTKTDASMANPETGYFYAAKAYVVEDGDVLTFYYDNQRSKRSGTTYDISDTRSDDSSVPAWAGTNENPNTQTAKVVFDNSFQNYYPGYTGYWFRDCKNLTTIEGIKNLNTSKTSSMSNMFNGCTALTSLDVSNFDTSNVKNMYCMFYMCYALTALDLSNFDTSKVTDMYGMFSNCRNLTSLDVSNFDTSNVDVMSIMFDGCYSLATLDVSSFDTSNVTLMNMMFNDCRALTSLDLSNFNTNKVTEMNRMFNRCYSLTTLNLMNFTPQRDTNFTEMFYDCENLETIYCNYVWYSGSVSENMFTGCTSLKGAVEFDPTKIDASMATPYGGYFTLYNGSVTEISSDDADAPVEVYNLYGVKVADTTSRLTPGIYIVRQGKTVKKIAVK